MHVFIIIAISTVVVAPSSNHHHWSINMEVPEHSRLHSQTTAAQCIVQTARLSNVAWTMCSTSTSSRYIHSLSVSYFISVCIVYAVLFHGCTCVCHMMQHIAIALGALDLHMHMCVCMWREWYECLWWFVQHICVVYYFYAALRGTQYSVYSVGYRCVCIAGSTVILWGANVNVSR